MLAVDLWEVHGLDTECPCKASCALVSNWIMRCYNPQSVCPLSSSQLNVVSGGGACFEAVMGL